MNRNLKRELFNIPNMLTYMRIVLIPLVIILMAYNTRTSLFYAAMVYSFAAVTDFFDGWLARNLNQQSLFGKFLDPLADKIIVMSILIMLVQLDKLPAWLVIVLLTREVSITGLRALASQEGLSLDVSQTGKWKTAFQMTGILALVIYGEFTMDYLLFTVDVNFFTVGLMCIVISLFFSLISAIQYFVTFLKAIDLKYRSEDVDDDISDEEISDDEDADEADEADE